MSIFAFEPFKRQKIVEAVRELLEKEREESKAATRAELLVCLCALVYQCAHACTECSHVRMCNHVPMRSRMHHTSRLCVNQGMRACTHKLARDEQGRGWGGGGGG